MSELQQQTHTPRTTKPTQVWPVGIVLAAVVTVLAVGAIGYWIASQDPPGVTVLSGACGGLQAAVVVAARNERYRSGQGWISRGFVRIDTTMLERVFVVRRNLRMVTTRRRRISIPLGVVRGNPAFLQQLQETVRPYINQIDCDEQAHALLTSPASQDLGVEPVPPRWGGRIAVAAAAWGILTLAVGLEEAGILLPSSDGSVIETQWQTSLMGIAALILGAGMLVSLCWIWLARKAVAGSNPARLIANAAAGVWLLISIPPAEAAPLTAALCVGQMLLVVITLVLLNTRQARRWCGAPRLR